MSKNIDMDTVVLSFWLRFGLLRIQDGFSLPAPHLDSTASFVGSSLSLH